MNLAIIKLPWATFRQNHRISLLSYKQAFEIYTTNKKAVQAADVLKRIGEVKVKLFN